MPGWISCLRRHRWWKQPTAAKFSQTTSPSHTGTHTQMHTHISTLHASSIQTLIRGCISLCCGLHDGFLRFMGWLYSLVIDGLSAQHRLLFWTFHLIVQNLIIHFHITAFVSKRGNTVSIQFDKVEMKGQRRRKIWMYSTPHGPNATLFCTSFLVMHNLVPPFHVRLPPLPFSLTGTRKSICSIHNVKQWCRPWSTPSMGPDVIESRSGLGCLKYGLNYCVQGSHKPRALHTLTSTHACTHIPFFPS